MGCRFLRTAADTTFTPPLYREPAELPYADNHLLMMQKSGYILIRQESKILLPYLPLRPYDFSLRIDLYKIQHLIDNTVG